MYYDILYKCLEMTYDGTLVMPSSYAVMDEDEMMYLEGGAIKMTINATTANRIVAALII